VLLQSKIIAWDKVGSKAKEIHGSGKKLVTTNGCFDILHWGHVSYLMASKKLGDVLWIALNADVSVKKIKDATSRPINGEKERALVLAALECVDLITIFEEATPENFLKLVTPNIHTKGGDYDLSKMPERKVIEAGGGKIQLIPFVEGFSTTKILEALKD